jgi:hypothetical protein
MPDTDDWLTEYGKSHAEIRFAAIYWVAVLTLVMGAVGILWSLPVPAAFVRISPILNWGSCFLMAAVVYYFIISMPLAIGMLPFVIGVATVEDWLLRSDWPGLQVSSGLFVLSLAGLYLGRAGQGAWQAVVRDLQLMMIAPIWLLSNLYRRFGIPY